jgi:MoaA/NifB/PqqE/SkfB family radical SAM enzyme
LGRDRIKHLKEIGIDRIQLSIDSLNAEEHDAFRNAKGSHERCMMAVDLCLEEDMDIFIQTVVDKNRLHSQEFLGFIDYFNQKGIGVFVSFAKPVGCWERNLDVMINETTDIEYFRELEKKHKVFSHLTPSYGNDIGCPAGINISSINGYGDLLPCIYLPVTIGNIFNEPLKVLLDRAKGLKPFRKDICVMAQSKEFVNKYLSKTYESEIIPVSYKEVFTSEDFIDY